MTPLQNLNLIFAGNATVTFSNEKAGTHLTYKVSKVENEDDKFFVSTLTGSDNESNYSYVGLVNLKTGSFYPSKKLKLDTKSVRGFDFVFNRIIKEHGSHPDLKIYHSGKCCRCGRKLTTPESIENGIGPECIKMI